MSIFSVFPWEKSTDSHVATENDFEDDFQHEFEERTHPARVRVRRGVLILNGSSIAINGEAMWRINVPNEASGDHRTKAICVRFPFPFLAGCHITMTFIPSNLPVGI